MYQKLSETEIEFMEHFNDPTSLTENLIPENIDAPSSWDESCDCVVLRPYQFAMQSYDYMYADDDTLTAKQNFRKKIGAGRVINIAGRNIGKTFLGLIIDAVLTLIHYGAIESCISSFDADHLARPYNKIASIVQSHPFFKMFHRKGRDSTVNKKEGIVLKSGHIMRQANERIQDKTKVGTQYHGMHYKKFYYDEFSYSTNDGDEKRIDSKHSHGVIERLFGIPDLRVGSPLGKILKEPKNINWICRLPQYVREDWDEETKEIAIDKYGGEQSTSYKLNVEAELTEGAYSKFDMDRIRKKCIKTDTKIKYFEVGKADFESFKDKIIIDRLPCDKVIIASDIGTTGSPSEATIFFDVNGSYKYHYNISLFKLTIKEQAKVFKWMYEKMGTAFISLDCTNADGRGIREELISLGVPEEHLSDFRMNQSIEIGHQKDKDGKIITDGKGKPVIRKEYTKEFAIQLLEKLLYEGKIDIPYDQKFMRQFTSFYEIGNKRKSWGTTDEDHLLDSFLLFALCVWENEQKNLNNQPPKKRCLGVI